jgi:hypothetical protein
MQAASAADSRINVPGAAVPIRYAIELLNKHNVSFEALPPSAPADAPQTK